MTFLASPREVLPYFKRTDARFYHGPKRLELNNYLSLSVKMCFCASPRGLSIILIMPEHDFVRAPAGFERFTLHPEAILSEPQRLLRHPERAQVQFCASPRGFCYTLSVPRSSSERAPEAFVAPQVHPSAVLRGRRQVLRCWRRQARASPAFGLNLN